NFLPVLGMSLLFCRQWTQGRRSASPQGVRHLAGHAVRFVRKGSSDAQRNSPGRNLSGADVCPEMGALRLLPGRMRRNHYFGVTLQFQIALTEVPRPANIKTPRAKVARHILWDIPHFRVESKNRKSGGCWPLRDGMSISSAPR